MLNGSKVEIAHSAIDYQWPRCEESAVMDMPCVGKVEMAPWKWFAPTLDTLCIPGMPGQPQLRYMGHFQNGPLIATSLTCGTCGLLVPSEGVPRTHGVPTLLRFAPTLCRASMSHQFLGEKWPASHASP